MCDCYPDFGCAIEGVFLKEGTVIAPKNFNGHMGMGVIAKVDFEKQHVLILTDFGNIVTNTFENLQKLFVVPYWYTEAYADGYPFPSIKERIQEQIELLQHAGEELCLR